MARDLTDDDRGKSVVTADGTHLGTVSSVENGRGQIDTTTSSTDTSNTTDSSTDTDEDSGLTEKLKSALGWDDEGTDTHELRNDDVETVNDNQVQLRNRY